MKRSEKKVLLAVMKKPCTFADLLRLRLPSFKIREATRSLIKSGNIQFCDNKFYTRGANNANGKSDLL